MAISDGLPPKLRLPPRGRSVPFGRPGAGMDGPRSFASPQGGVQCPSGGRSALRWAAVTSLARALADPMQTALADFIRETPEGRDANAILRSCVHCGFCTATCPTYLLLGDELDGPRGRIYLIKEMLEGREVTSTTRLHLDRCLTCKSCETTCPSGVKYGRLVDIGRHVIDQRAPRPVAERAVRWLVREAFLARRLFAFALAIGRVVKPVLPASIRTKILDARPAGVWPAAAASPQNAGARLLRAGRPRARHRRRARARPRPHRNLAAARARRGLLRRIAASLERRGAGARHRQAQRRCLVAARRSRCRGDRRHRQRLRRHGQGLRAPAAARPPIRGARAADREPHARPGRGDRRGVDADRARHRDGHRPAASRVPLAVLAAARSCGLAGASRRSCRRSGSSSCPSPIRTCAAARRAPIHCCSRRFRASSRPAKLKALEAGRPDVIATANIGCLAHLADGAKRPVRHWIESARCANAGRRAGSRMNDPHAHCVRHQAPRGAGTSALRAAARGAERPPAHYVRCPPRGRTVRFGRPYGH